MPAIHVTNVSKTYQTGRDRLQTLDRLSLTVEPGEFVSIIGASGCGKSTLFNLLAGLERPDSGLIEIEGKDGRGKRGLVAYMPQHDALFPWRSVVDNAILSTIVQRGDRMAARREAEGLLTIFGLEGFGNTLPGALSGGMRQRAALLRTILWKRPIMLLDEPFGALDAITRSLLQQWLLGLWERLERTILLVTHDVEEAILLSDRVYVLSPRPGKVQMEITVPLPRPRTFDCITSPEFIKLKATLLRVLS